MNAILTAPRVRAGSVVVLASALLLAACGPGKPPPPSSVGAHPAIGAPTAGAIPTIDIPKPTPWPAGGVPKAPPGFTVTRYAGGLDHPRSIYLLPNGDVLVAESASEPPPPTASFQTKLEAFFMKRSGAVEKSPDKIVLLRDSNHDGVVDARFTFLDRDVHRPFGMALIGSAFYVGATGAVWRYTYRTGDTKLDGAGEKIATLPVSDGGHWTRSLLAAPDGKTLYVGIGSSTNIADNGLAAEKNRADVLAMNPDGSDVRLFASGLRNPNSMAWEPSTGAMWTVVNERDMLGDDIVPDYLTRVRQGDFYGWPWSYWGKRVDTRVQPQDTAMVAKAIAPDYALGAHVAALGLAFDTGDALGADFKGGAFIGEHGSWNRSYLVGYKVVFVPFENGMPSGAPQDFLTGFIPDPKGDKVYGRPVGVAFDTTGALLVADDNGNAVWRVARK